ncbi:MULTISPECIES: YbaB/EbfC family nucleoid-associated protein [Megasphaera]|uniref:Nucleoid-associated protein HMPREF3182_01252 n=1 Tax=Megasphaera hutchinsoni TaxID=1588748 RepID=A0A134CE56_9FIRM|nr:MULTISPECIES: YbaB/EbfC family nucleoid-associated protein [Megasphaera]EGS32174.1 DNA-binding protein, YbaB/EbfC family [Megasphaera sp. UPII 135-E]KXB90498.1 DNA-binding protein, YbaB/EbfC family [Megasphaera hutchinsoni]MUP48053.1 YbaB/EbfC family nucleoid-associated protein [Veillonellaceae bacterium M2-8]MUP59740.1 YbaB/EbfC family nucleoid-associated protein [Veillonellaceae bacterium M2-4]
MFGGNMQGMMKKVQKMQKEMQKLQEDLKKRTVEVTVGGGALVVVMNGEKMLEAVHIDKNISVEDDMEMLEDLFLAAVNEANRKIDELTAKEMGKITGGMNIPGLF